MKFALFLLCLMTAWPLKREPKRDVFIVWNVGQGLWTTLVEFDVCRHVDAGGERPPWRELVGRCGEKRNELFLSHWDWDHVGGVAPARRRLPQMCVASEPGGVANSDRKRALLRGLPECPGRPPSELNEIHWAHAGHASNDESRVYFARGGFLLPGDSTKGEEKVWAEAAPPRARWLIAGHHGSRTSTSDLLLAHLPHLRGAVISARRKKYGHPHAEVVARLRDRKIPILRTEEWGHFVFEL